MLAPACGLCGRAEVISKAPSWALWGGEAPSVYRVARTEKEGSDKRKSVIEILEEKDGRRKGCGHPDHASSRRRGREEGVHGDRNFKTAQL